MNYYNSAVGISDTGYQRLGSVYLKDKIVPEENDEIWNKPVNIYTNYLGNLNTKSFLNIAYVYDGYSFYNRHTLYGGYGYTFFHESAATLTVGGRLALNIDQVDWDELGQISDKPSESMHLTPDLDIGTRLRWKGLDLGISSKNFLATDYKVDGEELISNYREWYISGSYTFGFFDRKLSLSPYMLFLSERDVELDAGLNVNLFHMIDVSYAYRIFELRNIASAKVKFMKRFRIGAAIDWSSVFSDTNIDFMVSYTF
jgi:hypothetical protein